MDDIRHIAIIMDGNGRWAEQRGLPRWKGHEAGAEAVRRATEAACSIGLPTLTLFAFSSENWKRPTQEVHILFSLLRRYLVRERQELIRNGIRLSAIGRRDRFTTGIREELHRTETATQSGKRLHLRLALDYGSRGEIVEAVRTLADRIARCELRPEQIDVPLVTRVLSADSAPDPDLIIRTAGEKRLSNFLLWQAAYSELWFSPKLWPDFTGQDLLDAAAEYRKRTRKFGGLSTDYDELAHLSRARTAV